MAAVQIEDLEVVFPFKPYPTQVRYMQNVITALNTGTNALLESPTGTGKTLCLLCAALAWLFRRRKQNCSTLLSSPNNVLGTSGPFERDWGEKIVYCSRTHAQLAQVIRELKRIPWCQEVRMALLGSREHLCVNSEVLRLPSMQAQQSVCTQLRDNKACRFFRGLYNKSTTTVLSGTCAVHDIEDLVMEGKKYIFCPYFFERDAAKEANIVFMPYSYILDLQLQRQLPFELKDCVLIVDEAHNLPSVLSAAGCLSLHPLELTNAIHDCSRAIAMQQLLGAGKKEADEAEMQKEAMREQELAALKLLLCRLESDIEAEKMTDNEESTAAAMSGSSETLKGYEMVRSGSYMRKFLARSLITSQVFDGETGASGMNDVMTTAITVLTQSERPAAGLVQVQRFLSTVFSSQNDEATRFILQEQKDDSGRRSGRTLGFWQLDNSRELLNLSQQLRSLLLTSGTLSPLNHFAAELGIPFEVRLKGSHVIEPDQVFASVLCKSPSGHHLNSSYAFRSSVEYRVGMGMSLVNISRNTPGGTLVFFPSYAAMNATVELWRSGTGCYGDTKPIWELLLELKPIFIEPVNATDLATAVGGFQKAVDDCPRKGAIFLAVCRGKISEGVDFADHHGRCVVITGIPFANHTDLFVRLKREYLTQVAPQRPLVNGRPFTGSCWYRNEAMRTVNQCAGRVIRHINDYGAVILADERFAQQLDSLSEWVAARTEVHREFRDCYTAVSRFFARRRPPMQDGCLLPGKAAMPCVAVNRPASASVPDSAENAKRFARLREMEAVEEARAQQRRCRVEAAEQPTQRRLSVVSTPEAGALPLGHAHARSSMSGTLTLSVFPKMQRQQLSEISDRQEDATPRSITQLVGRTSQEFCSFLKERVCTASYGRFKDALKAIALLRRNLEDEQDMPQAFASIVDKLHAIFHEAHAEGAREVMETFARHLPNEFRSLYHNLLQLENRGKQ